MTFLLISPWWQYVLAIGLPLGFIVVVIGFCLLVLADWHWR